jgi:multidrug efflux system outer membrane protein
VKLKTLLPFCLVVAAQTGCRSSGPKNPLAEPEPPPAVLVDWREYFADERLRALISQALEGSPDLEAVSQRLRGAQAGLVAADGALRPVVEAVAGASMRRFGRYTMDGAGNAGTLIIGDETVPVDLPDYRLGFQANWELDLWGRLRNLRAAAVSRLAAAREEICLVRTSLIAALAEAYYSFLGLDESRALIEDMIAVQYGALDTIREQRRIGMANELSVRQFEADLDRLQALLVEVELAKIQQEAAFNFLLGRPAGSIERSAAPVEAWVLPELEVVLEPASLLNRPEVRIAEHRLVAADADVEAARAAFLPSLSLGATLGLQAFRPELLSRADSFAYSVGGDLVGPLFNRAAIEALLEAARAEQAEALVLYKQAIIAGLLEVDQQLRSSRQLAEGYAIKARQVSKLTEAVEAAGELFRSGSASYLELLTVQQAALEARLELVEWRRRQVTASIGLYRALGGGSRGLDGDHGEPVRGST